MASYDPYERDYGRRPANYVRDDRRDERDPRFLDSREYGRGQLVPRARPQDSDLSVEEIRREFPPPTGRDIRRARSAEHGYYAEYDDDHYRRGYDSRYDRSRDRHSDHGRHSRGSYYGDDDRHKSKSMSKQEKIIAAVAGAALLAGGKELYDRHEAKTDHTDVHRNPLSSVALAGFGALAGYQGAEFYSKQQAKKDQKTNLILQRGRDGQIEYYSDEEDDPRYKKGHKNFLENALAATGLGAAVKSLTGGGRDDDRHSENRSRRGSPTGSRAGSPRSRSGAGGSGANKVQKAAMASLLAGATEAFRVAKEPGSWKGEKTKRILTAAAGAATVDAATGDKHGKLGLAESVIGGLVGNRLINGSKREIEEDKATGRSRSRSRARSQGGHGGGGGTGLAALATAGLGALGAKAALDRSRSRSRARSRSSSRGRGYDSRDGSPDRHRRSRSRSVVDKARNSLAKLGIGAGAAGAVDDHRRRDQDDFDDRGPPRRARGYSDEYDDDRLYARSRDGGRRDSSRRRSTSRYTSESDLGDSDDDLKHERKMRGKQIITTGLATVATIHAAHGVYQSMEKRIARQRAVKEGRLSAADANTMKSKAMIKDAASVGIAAMGIKGAFEEMKEAKDMTQECHNFKQERARRHEKREMKRRRRNQPGDRPRRAESWPARPPPPYDGRWDDYGPRYYDDNPYSAGRLPAPPVGYNRQ